ncbi:MAG: hypothetical protein R2815_01850 [Flavobacteriales bacterium]|nr:hypothetical protein [Flavobacteriales bacterium]
MRNPFFLSLLLLLGSAGCTGPSPGDLCSVTFKPYPDLTPDRIPTARNQAYVAGMKAYDRGDHAEAIAHFNDYARLGEYDKGVHLYLACSHLALNEPYDAELQLDHLERSNLRQFADQAEWYTVVCWVCSGQLDRARAGAERIAAQRHTYTQEAKDLLKALGPEHAE